MRRPLSASVALALLAGCASAPTAFRPSRGMASELSLAQGDTLEVTSGARPVARAPDFVGLADFVRCVPEARRHAEAARSAGSKAAVLGPLSIGFALVGLGGLAGLGYRDSNEGAMFGLLIGGAALEIAAVVIAGNSFSARWQAQGNAVDAVNYYNDAVGFRGGSCDARTEARR